MQGKELFIFYLIFGVCNRLYMLAVAYIDVKIFHSIGLHFCILSLICYIIYISTEHHLILFWRMFLAYEVLSIIVFCKSQLSMDHFLAKAEWESGLRTSALNRVFGNIGFIQDIFIPAFIVLVIFLMYKNALNLEG